jgi:hypothetical protein
MNLSIWATYKNGAGNYMLQDISPMLKTVTSSRDKSQVARKFDVTYAYPINDKNQPRFQVGLGTYISIKLDQKEIFRGWVIYRSLNSESEEMSFTAYDCLYYLTKSKVTKNFKSLESEYCVENIAKELNMPYNIIPTTGIKITRLITGEPAYQAIMEIYSEVSKQNKKQYIPYAELDMLSIMEKGQIIDGMRLAPEENMQGSTYTDSLDDMVNKVLVYDSSGNYIGEVSNDADVKDFGIFQDNYQKEDNVDWKTGANNCLKPFTNEFTVDVLGNWKYQTGYAITVQIPYIDKYQNTVVYIDADTHTWNLEEGLYTCQLTLNTQNTMDAGSGS